MRSSFLPKSLLLLWVTTTFGNVAMAEPAPGEIVSSFYESYLDYLGNTSRGNRPALAFSRDFRELIEENERVCKEFATGVCGFGADGDIYLDSQEYEQGLTLQSSGFRRSEEVKGVVTVSLNVYPSISTSDGFYNKQVTFKFVLEGGAWVVDDILYADQVSSRVRIREENELYRKNPDPDSPHVTQKRGTDVR